MFNHWTVLVIDDEEDIRDVLSLTLIDAGYEVLTAEDGEAGLRLCRAHSPAIVITDIRMPRMNGIQVLEAIKEYEPKIEVIVATAYGEMDLAIQALQLDASDFITKPIHDETLHLALKRARKRFTDRCRIEEYTAFLEREQTRTIQEMIQIYDFQKNLIESSMDGILGCDETETVVLFNQGMERIMGRTRDEVLRKTNLQEIVEPREYVGLKQALDSAEYGGHGRLFLYETLLTTKTGQPVPVQTSAAIMNDQGEARGLVLFFRDLRELRRLEREMADQARILHQDKMMSLGRLAASVAHEINNPLAGILNYVRLMIRMLDRGPLGEEQRQKFDRYLDLVEKETDRCARIVSNLLTFSRKSPPAFDAVDIDELVNRCLILSQHKLALSNIELDVRIDPGIPPVRGDFNQLQQCVINLIFNAIDAMSEGGRLIISATFRREPAQVHIVVEDTGHGIPESFLPHIFEPFFTTKTQGQGVGLGLSTVFGIMERHGGTITVDSQAGAGARFTLQLPVS